MATTKRRARKTTTSITRAPKRRAKRRTKRAKTRTDAVRLTSLEKTVASHGKRLDRVEKDVGAVRKALKGYRR